MNILIVAAHPDDEVLGCGGTIARFAREGHNVFAAILGQGVTSRYSRPESAEPVLIRSLQESCHKASKLLGVKEVVLCNLPDNRLDTMPLVDIVKLVEELVDRFKPESVYTHHRGDLNIDHAIAHRAVLTATRPMSGCPVSELCAFEIPSSTEWAFGQLKSSFTPNLFIDIRDTLALKIDALKLYEGEIREFPHPRSQEAIEALAKYRGASVGFEASEAFELIRKQV